MGSRRTTTHLSFGNGRSCNGGDVIGRSGGCSYLVNVRPENRSTFCSVMAQLTEEKQPSFETTLKSKAVSENCNVKFSCVVTGYPSPQVTWYKDDAQLDRYCGLPKYEIFRNGQNHSLHIYKCTVEDAAIYQASAINSKGIVSCSGVLEVGEMNEFKIHQRYFTKLKQKAENRRKEPECKENQEQLRTVSPDRTQRKRRSTMEAFLSTPSSLEEESSEENHQAEASDTDNRRCKEIVEPTGKHPVQLTNGEAATTNEPIDTDNGSKNDTYVYDSANKTFTAHYQPKSPFVKKKIKISNSTKMNKSNTGERLSGERKVKDGTTGNTEESMDIEKISSSATLDSDMKEECEKTATERMMCSPTVLKEDKRCTGINESTQKEKLPASVQNVALLSPSHREPEIHNKKAKHEKEMDLKDSEEHSEKQKIKTSSTPQRPSNKSMRPNMLKEKNDATPMEKNDQLKASADECFRDSFNETEGTACDMRTTFLLRPCELAADQLFEKETRSCQKQESVARPVVPSEVTPARTEKSRNDTPVNLKLQPDQTSQKTDDTHTSSSLRDLQAPADKTTKGTWKNSRDSIESGSVLLAHKHQSPLLNPDENSSGCNVSPTMQQIHADTVEKTVEETNIHDSEEIKGNQVGKVFGQTVGVTSGMRRHEMETKPCDMRVKEETRTEKINCTENKDQVVLEMDSTIVKTTKRELKSGVVGKTGVETQKKKPETLKVDVTPPAKPTKTTKSQEQNNDSKEKTIPLTKVLSIAELLRSQLRALEAAQANPDISTPVAANITQDPTPSVTQACEEFRVDNRECKQEVKMMRSSKETKHIDDITPSNIKETLMAIYQELFKAENGGSSTTDTTSAAVKDLYKPSLIPVLSHNNAVVEVTELPHVRKDNETIMEISQETDGSPKTPIVEYSAEISQSGSKNMKESSHTLMAEFTDRHGSVSNPPENMMESKFPLRKDDIQKKKEIILEQSGDLPAERVEFLIPQTDLGNKMGKRIAESSATMLPDQHKTEENTETKFSAPIKSSHSSKNDPSTGLQTNNIPSVVSESLRSDFVIDSTLESGLQFKKRNAASPIPSATPKELASGARRKVLLPQAKTEELPPITSPAELSTLNKETSIKNSQHSTKSTEFSTCPSLFVKSPEEQTSAEKRFSPLPRRKTASESQEPGQLNTEKVYNDGQPAEKVNRDPFKAPQVIRKIRGEIFADASGHLKLWCQFFNVLIDSTITWYKNEKEIAQVKRNAGNETQVNLAIVQASIKDSGVYGCSITNQHGTDSTDLLLSAEILTGMSLREDLGVGEEIEMTPLIFNKGLADSGVWGSKFFGRITMMESHIGEGCYHKVWRAKAIYGLEPVFESGNTCIIKVRSPITYGGKEESCLTDRNMDMMKQKCKIQNLAREYCKIFSAEARVIESFGAPLEIIPVYLIYRPANTIPYATVETDLKGDYKKYSILDHLSKINMTTGSEAEQKCCALQHWIFQWTNGNLLLSRLEGVDTKITNVEISVKSTGHQGLSIEGDPKVFQQFVSQHKCNYFCGLLGLKFPKVMDSLSTPAKVKGSRSPLLQRKMATGSFSPQTGRKSAGSPRVPRKSEQDGRKTPTKQKQTDCLTEVKTK